MLYNCTIVATTNEVNMLHSKDLKAIFHFIETCSAEEAYHIIEEIRCVHDNLYAFDPDSRLLAKIESSSMNGHCIQLNMISGE